jgi:hypothetical protein
MHTFTIFTILYGIVPAIAYKFFKVKISSIAPLVVVVCTASLYEFFGTFVLKINSDYWILCYKILAFSAIHYFYLRILEGKYVKVFLLFISIFLILFVCTICMWSKINFFNTIAYFNCLQTIIVLTFSVLWFIKIFTNLELESLTRSPEFYFVAGLILYYSGTVFLFLLGGTIFKFDKANFQSFWMLNIILNLTLRSLLIIGIWKGRTKLMRYFG